MALGRSALAGGILGGIYGGFADNSSVFHGAASGAMIGLGAASAVGRAAGLGRQMMIGGVLGGTYGLFADNTSVLGGAFTGAALGAGYGAARIAGHRYNAFRGMAQPRAMAASNALYSMGADSRKFIGSTYTNARNKFNGLRQQWREARAYHAGG
jgi:hypothetical protein